MEPCGTHSDDVCRVATLARRGAEMTDASHRRLGDPTDSSNESSWRQRLRTWQHALPARQAHAAAEGISEPLELMTVFAIPIAEGRRRLRTEMRALFDACSFFPGDVDRLEALFVKQLLRRLKFIAQRTLALEMHVARLQGQLEGDTPAARFQSFIERLGRPEIAQAILAEYPVLARQALVCIEQWGRFSLGFLRHLCADWSQLHERFSIPADAGPLVELDGDAGDSHCDGKAVLILRFKSGFRLVYKPRSLAVEQRFQELLAWCNRHGANPPFRTLRVLDRADHGWVEFVEPKDCTTPSEIDRFYQRQGGYIALLYVLQATDFHFENLIAAGEHPILVDLETVFHERMPGATTDPALRGLWNSAVSIGLLPRVSYFDGFDRGIDFSGLGAALDRDVEIPTYEFLSSGTDQMRQVRVQTHRLNGTHRPTLGGADVVPAAYGDRLMQGFGEMYGLMLRHRDALAADDGPLAAFADVETRFIARATQIYAIFLEQSSHPDYLRNPADRDRWFSRLWGQADEATGLKPLVPAERADLERNDIPLFHSRPGSRDLWTSRGERIEEYFGRTPLETVRERLAGLGPEDLARQTWLIQAALAKLRQPGHEPPDVPAGMSLGATTDPDDALAAAIRIGERLSTLAWQNTTEAGWLGIHPCGSSWFIDALGLEAADGLPKIALFLAQLDAITGRRRFAPLIRKTVTAINRRLRESDQAESREHFAGSPSTPGRSPLADENLSAAERPLEMTDRRGDAVLWPIPQSVERPRPACGLADRGLELLQRARTDRTNRPATARNLAAAASPIG